MEKKVTLAMFLRVHKLNENKKYNNDTLYNEMLQKTSMNFC